MQDDELIGSSADFGRAYLSVGRATRSIQRLSRGSKSCS